MLSVLQIVHLFSISYCCAVGIEENQNGVDSNVGEDSDSLGNSKSSKTSITPPTKEKRKPFFKKVSLLWRRITQDKYKQGR
jgi:hypothetical protein